MPPTKFAGGGVFETSRMFQTASPASLTPGRRPTRGSGLGAAVETGAGGSPAVVVAGAVAHADVTVSVNANASEGRAGTRRPPESANAMRIPLECRSVSAVSTESAGSRRALLEQHLRHSGDLGGLVHVHIGRKLEHGPVLDGARCADELLDHRDPATVMLDHEDEEEAVELRALRFFELLHLLRGQQ